MGGSVRLGCPNAYRDQLSVVAMRVILSVTMASRSKDRTSAPETSISMGTSRTIVANLFIKKASSLCSDNILKIRLLPQEERTVSGRTGRTYALQRSCICPGVPGDIRIRSGRGTEPGRPHPQRPAFLQTQTRYVRLEGMVSLGKT